MAITGLLMVLFVVGHLLGNLTIFAGVNGINSYAEHLHELPPLVWGTRIVMGTAVLFHLILSIQITNENKEANPTKYAVDRSLRATFASKTMIYTGLLIGAFVIFHLLHFTFRVTPGLVLGNDALNRFDVFTMVVSSFKSGAVAIGYVLAVTALFLHLSHGVQSTFQSLGFSNDEIAPKLGVFGKVLSAIFLVGYGSIPVLILIGVLAK
jgi:succinate dehydrogenase / fumarate reductase cytochrome b subunit